MTAKPNSIIIVGGGLAGMGCALAIANRAMGNCHITIIDRQSPPVAGAKDKDERDKDGRAYAIAARNFSMLQTLGVTDSLKGAVQAINDILISDGVAGATPSPLTLHFDSAAQSADGEKTPSGYMIEAHSLTCAVADKVRQSSCIDFLTASVVGHESDSKGVTVTLDSGKTLRAALLIAADGRGSPTRKRAGIEVTGWDYDQKAIVTTVCHELPHEGVAHELFMPTGPFAILPLTDDSQGRHRSSIVWTERARAASAAAALPAGLFEAELARRFGDHWGKVTVCAAPRVFALNLQMAKSFRAPRLALIGDAAHGIHPIAGQGLNLGLRDIAAMADVVAEAIEAGSDIGADMALTRYEQWRRFDSQLVASASDVFNKLFSNNASPLRHARRLAIAAVDKLAPAKALFMNEASGASGQLPTLLQ
ncbi:MAG: FAD-dependent monooxygenase [Robiginitomaculum sp.]